MTDTYEEAIQSATALIFTSAIVAKGDLAAKILNDISFHMAAKMIDLQGQDLGDTALGDTMSTPMQAFVCLVLAVAERASVESTESEDGD